MQQRHASLADMTALEARDELARGSITAVDLAGACLARVAEREPAVGAFAHLDRELVLRQAQAADEYRATGRPLGPLHGVPVAIKDVIDTRDHPTENGTVLDAGRRPRADAAAVARLREAGAIIFGKTVTTELAVFTPGRTRNPHDPDRTPGGSSSGSAAAVAAGMVPLAVGTQTNGSVIRPASFCGVVGYKPTRGLVSRHGVLTQSAALDHVGVFARTVEDAALAVDAMAGYDDRDASSVLAARPQLLAAATRALPLPPAFALVTSPAWPKASREVEEGFAELEQALGERIVEVELPPIFDRAHDWHRAVNYADLALNYGRYVEKGAERVSDRLRGMIEAGKAVSAVDYNRALGGMAILSAGLDAIFDRFDAIVTPAAPGEAPIGLESTGDPAFSTIWTFCGVPAVTLPLLSGPNGMPVGVQLVGRAFGDGRLLAAARWLNDAVLAESAG